MTKPLSPDEAAAIHAGMDTYAVLVFHDQPINDDQQLAFTRSHRARPFPAHEPRDMRRTTLRGDGPTVAQAAA